MGKLIFLFIVAIIIIGFFYYYKPEKFDEIVEKFESIGSDLKEDLQSKQVNLGKPTLPCQSDANCNENMVDCENVCVCIEGDCFKNETIV